MPLIPTHSVITAKPEKSRRQACQAAFLLFASPTCECPAHVLPLPPAPTKRAALLSTEAYDAPARSVHKAQRKSEAHTTGNPLADKPQALDFEPRSGGGELHPALRDTPDIAPEKMIQVETRKAAAAPVAQPAPRARKKRAMGPAKLFVLDTNVLLHDPMCLFRFEEHATSSCP